MQLTKNLNVTSRKELVDVHLGVGDSIDVGLLRENHHKINLIAGEDL